MGLCIYSNAIKFTHKGKVGINLNVVLEPSFAREKDSLQKTIEDQSSISGNGDQNHAMSNECRSPVKSECPMNEDTKKQPHSTETTVWIRCDVYDTGIGIPGFF